MSFFVISVLYREYTFDKISVVKEDINSAFFNFEIKSMNYLRNDMKKIKSNDILSNMHNYNLQLIKDIKLFIF